MSGSETSGRGVPRVSIGLPVRNGIPTIGPAIESLLAQEFSDFELIISDNASDDGTADVCASFARTDRRITFEPLPRNIGASRNFERVMLPSRAEYFMWAAHDDVRHPSFVRLGVDALDRAPNAVLAISDIEVRHPGGAVSTHPFPRSVTSVDPSVRLRGVLRGGGFSAIYGLLRRSTLARTRRLSTLRQTRWVPLAPDYTVVELCLMGPFAVIDGPLLACRGRAIQPPHELDAMLDPEAPVRTSEAGLSWLLRDLWTLGGRYGLGVRQRAALLVEIVRSFSAPGTLHDVMLGRNRLALRAAIADRRPLDAAGALVERLALQRLRRRGGDDRRDGLE